MQRKKITDGQKEDIRKAYSNGEKLAVLARQYDVTNTTIKRVVDTNYSKKSTEYNKMYQKHYYHNVIVPNTTPQQRTKKEKSEFFVNRENERTTKRMTKAERRESKINAREKKAQEAIDRKYSTKLNKWEKDVAILQKQVQTATDRLKTFETELVILLNQKPLKQ